FWHVLVNLSATFEFVQRKTRRLCVIRSDRPSGGSRFHQADKLVKQGGHVVRTGAGFRMPLKTVSRLIRAANALQRAIKQRFVSRLYVRRQRRLVHSKAVILA